MKRGTILFACILLFVTCVYAQKPMPDFLKIETPWADSVMKTLTLEEKIGQLIMVTAYAEQGESDEVKILSQIEKGKIGGVLFLKTSPKRLAQLSNKYQESSKIPLFIALDGENGLSFRLTDSPVYPYSIALGAIQDNELIYKMGREIGLQCHALGINLNFSPVVDVNSNLANPVINYRSFGSDANNVAHKGAKLAMGMQKERIIVSAKHFPGHGDTSTDSHLALPTVKHDYRRLDSVDFVPFKEVVNAGINGIMTAHISMPLIDPSEYPATTSKLIIGGCLRDSLGFSGIVFSDAMNMKGLLHNSNESQAIIRALNAGVDVVEFVTEPLKAIAEIKKAIVLKNITIEQIDQKCHKVLKAKEWAQINKAKPICLDDIEQLLNCPEYKLTYRKLVEASITLIKNDDEIIPVQHFDSLKIASVSIGDSNETIFQKRLSDYTEIDNFSLAGNASSNDLSKILTSLKNYDIVVAAVSNNSLKQKEAVKAILEQTNPILTFFCSPFNISKFNGIENSKAILLAYANGENENDLAAQAIMGSIRISGKAPIPIKNICPAGFGIDRESIGRLGFSIPEEVGIDGSKLTFKMDSACWAGVTDSLYPGCQVLVAKNGKIIFRKSYGFHTYKKEQEVTNSDLYDWASITKITSPQLPLMKLYDEKKIDLDVPISKYWDLFAHCNKQNITLRQTLAHQSGLKSGLLFYGALLSSDSKLKDEFVSNKPSEQKSVRLSGNWYIDKDYKKVLQKKIAESNLTKRVQYLYSDYAAMLYPDLISIITKEDFVEYLNRNFYRPLGLTRITYNPAQKYPLKEIVPTEIDYTFRKEEIHGYVHDENCAMMGGISGHAGLFGTSLELAKIMQLYLQKGYYGGQQYFSSATTDLFTKTQYPNNRRGLGFDKPIENNRKLPVSESYPAPQVSDSSFGHSGFTGTFVWADPEYQLIYVFLSNRTYPSSKENRLSKSNLRTNIQQEIFKCLGSYKPNIE